MVWDLFRLGIAVPRVHVDVPRRRRHGHGKKSSSLCPEMFVEKVVSRPRADGSTKQSLRWVVKKSRHVGETAEDQVVEVPCEVGTTSNVMACTNLGQQKNANTPPCVSFCSPPHPSTTTVPPIPFPSNLYPHPQFYPCTYLQPISFPLSYSPTPYGPPLSPSTPLQQGPAFPPLTASGTTVALAPMFPPSLHPPLQQTVESPSQQTPLAIEALRQDPTPRRLVRYAIPFDTTLAPRMTIRVASEQPQTPPSSSPANQPSEPEPASSVEQNAASAEQSTETNETPAEDTPSTSESGKEKSNGKGKDKGKGKQPKSILKKPKNVNFEAKQKEKAEASKSPPAPSVEDGSESDVSDESDLSFLSGSEESFIDLFPPAPEGVRFLEYSSDSSVDSIHEPVERPQSSKDKGKGKTKGKGKGKSKN